MATIVLPKDTEFNDGNTARGTDVRANDQAIRDFINGAQIDSGNVNLAANFPWTGQHTFDQGDLKIGSNIVIPVQFDQQGLYNIAFAQGADSSQLKITSASGADLSASNPGFVRIRSSTAGTYRTFTVTANVTIDLTGAHWGLDTLGNTTGSILRVYAIDDNGTLRWGVGYQGGFYYIRNTQDDTTATNINLPEEILTDSGVGTDNSPMRDVGWVLANFTDASNEWAISEYHPNESADGLWHPWVTTYGGFSVNPSGGYRRWMSVGQTAYVEEVPTTDGTSNATTYTMVLPVKPRQSTPTANARLIPPLSLRDNTVTATLSGAIDHAAGNVTLNLFKDSTGTAWTNTGGKRAGFKYSYEMFQP